MYFYNILIVKAQDIFLLYILQVHYFGKLNMQKLHEIILYLFISSTFQFNTIRYTLNESIEYHTIIVCQYTFSLT